MARHEKGCTANPARECGVCRLAGFSPQPLIALVEFCRKRANWDISVDESHPPYGGLDKTALEELRALADGCPVCMFAALRQAHVYADKELFNMKEALRDVWGPINQRREAYEHGY